MAELLAKSFHESFRYRQRRQQQQEVPQRTIESPSMSTRCSVCDTMARQQQQPTNTRLRSALSRSHSHDYNHRDDFEYNRHPSQQPMYNEYERAALPNTRITRPFGRSLERNSMNSSRRSFDNDTTLADEESIKPMEYYRG